MMKASSIAMMATCAALYAVVGRLTDFGVTVGGVAFWPAAVIPAVFAFLFGPWTGGFGAAIGIFIRDMLFHGDPLLSLSAGVSANFVGFFVIGYMSRSNLGWKKIGTSIILGSVIIVIGLSLPTILLPAETQAFTGLSALESFFLFVASVVVSAAVMMIAAKYWPEWRNYAVGSIIGLGVGATIVATTVWAYSQIFFSSQGYFKAPIGSTFLPLIFVWTFATEIPFILLLGPPIAKVLIRAFPSFKPQPQSDKHTEHP